MSPRLFEVEGLRIAVNDQEAAVRADRQPPTTAHGEQLPFGWVEAIPGVSYGVEAGETLALIGESSSGKSLMLLGAFGLLPGGTRPLGGTTTYRGVTYQPAGRRDEPERPLRRRERKRLMRAGTVLEDSDPVWERIVATEVGFLFQNPIASWTPILEIGPQAGEVLDEHTELPQEEIEERVMDALGEVRLPRSQRLFRAYSTELSRGMGQRAMLAAALVKAPSLLIADEPLSGLDVSVAAAILDLIKDLRDRRGMAMVIVTHDLAVVSRIADRVAVVYGGRIVEAGTIVDVYRTPQHPYTSGLLGSMPALARGRLRPIPGEQPALSAMPADRCVFADRCGFADETCLAAEPTLREIGSGEVACHHAESLDLPGVG
ncbi:MAG: ABC transporter ATP-binding protein [Actinomycetota bacterium]